MRQLYELELNRIVIGKKNTEIFLENLENKMDFELQALLNEVKCRHNIIVEDMGKSLLKELKTLYIIYTNMKEKEMVGCLSYIYISFLRTSFIDESPVYRIDYYDEYGRISEIECSAMWEIDEIWGIYKNSRKKIHDYFNSQTVIKQYVFDQSMLKLAEKVHYFTKDYIKEAVKLLVNEDDLWNGEKPEIWIGEYLDRSEKIEVGNV